MTSRETDDRMPGADARPAGVHRSPNALLKDAIHRSLGWASENELRDLVSKYTGRQLSLGEANQFSQEVADIVVRALTAEGKPEESAGAAGPEPTPDIYYCNQCGNQMEPATDSGGYACKPCGNNDGPQTHDGHQDPTQFAFSFLGVDRMDAHVIASASAGKKPYTMMIGCCIAKHDASPLDRLPTPAEFCDAIEETARVLRTEDPKIIADWIAGIRVQNFKPCRSTKP